MSKLLFMYEPSFLRNPVVSVFELSDPARSIKFCKRELTLEKATHILYDTIESKNSKSTWDPSRKINKLE